MKTLFRNSTHKMRKSHDCLIAEIKGKKIKLTYEAYNAVEKFNVEIFDGNKFNVILNILDMGVTQENDAYNIWSDLQREARANNLIKIAKKMCEVIIE